MRQPSPYTEAPSLTDQRWIPAHVALSEEIFSDPEEPRAYRGLHSLWPEWHAKARCLGDTGTTFFGSPEPNERPPYTTSDIKAAKLTCADCPVFDLCLHQAIYGREEYGVWAGTTTKERQKYFRMIRKGQASPEMIVDVIMERHDGASQRHRFEALV